ncbi:MAG: cytidine deaminase [Alphaproteobacteria bacterium]|nr:cytidine deaminase [Alphaproteobacteria bacterium]
MVMLDTLFEKASETRKNAYAPYSSFNVGAAILTPSGHIYVGANVENVSYPCGMCAESGAISAMIAAGEYRIADILIAADSKNLISPCGACLQRIAEFADDHTMIHLADLEGIKQSYPIAKLLPIAFAEDLKK